MGHQSYVLLCTETTLSNPPVVLSKSSCNVHLLRSPCLGRSDEWHSRSNLISGSMDRTCLFNLLLLNGWIPCQMMKKFLSSKIFSILCHCVCFLDWLKLMSYLHRDLKQTIYYIFQIPVLLRLVILVLVLLWILNWNLDLEGL